MSYESSVGRDEGGRKGSSDVGADACVRIGSLCGQHNGTHRVWPGTARVYTACSAKAIVARCPRIQACIRVDFAMQTAFSGRCASAFFQSLGGLTE